jgi:hypothetical protein
VWIIGRIGDAFAFPQSKGKYRVAAEESDDEDVDEAI